MEGVLGLMFRLSSPSGEAEVLWLAGQLHITIREERDVWPARRAEGNPTRVCLRVTTGTSEVDTVR